MKYKVTTAAFDNTTSPPTPVKMNGNNKLTDYLAEEIIDTEKNVLFADASDVHDIEDTVLEFWNRLNPSSIDGPAYTHNPASKVVVVDVRPL